MFKPRKGDMIYVYNEVDTVLVSKQRPILAEFVKMSENGKYICAIEHDEDLSYLAPFDYATMS